MGFWIWNTSILLLPLIQKLFFFFPDIKTCQSIFSLLLSSPSPFYPLPSFPMDIDQLKPITNIPYPEYYEFFMDWKTPVVIATLYAVTIHLLNPSRDTAKLSRVEAKNRGVNNASSSSKLFTTFVFLHNLFLSIYSGVTFVNMVQALHRLFNNYSVHDAVSYTTETKERAKNNTCFISIVMWMEHFGTKHWVTGDIYFIFLNSMKWLTLPSFSSRVVAHLFCKPIITRVP